MQPIAPRHILLTRSEEPLSNEADDGVFRLDLEKRDLRVSIEPLLHVHPRPISHEQREALQNQPVQALIFTSAHAIRQWVKQELPLHMPVLTVGDHSAAIARELGFQQVESARGSAADLLALAQKKLNPAGDRVIYACAHITSFNLTTPLEQQGFRVETVVLYDSQPITQLSAAVEQDLTSGRITDLVLFSARAAETFSNLVMQNHSLQKACRHIRVLCFSSAICQKIQHLKWLSMHVSGRPDLPNLLELIESTDPSPGDKSMPTKDTMARLLGFSSLGLVFLMIVLLLAAPQLFVPAAGPGLIPATSFSELEKSLQGLQLQVQNQQKSLEALQANAPTIDITAFNNRLSAIDQRLTTLSTNPNNNSAVNITSLDQSINNIRQQVSALENTLLQQSQQMISFSKSLQEIQQLHRELDQLTGRLNQTQALLNELQPVTAKIAALDQQVQQLQQNPRIDQNPALAALFLTASQFESALANGQPFINELTAIQRLGAQQPLIRDWLAQSAEIQPWGNTGLPSYGQLQQELEIIADKISQGLLSDELRSSGWNQQIADQFSGLITIRPIGPQTVGDDLLSRLARAEANFANKQWPAVLHELNVNNLPVSLATWRSQLQARLQADSLLAQFKNLLLNHFMTNP